MLGLYSINKFDIDFREPVGKFLMKGKAKNNEYN